MKQKAEPHRGGGAVLDSLIKSKVSDLGQFILLYFWTNFSNSSFKAMAILKSRDIKPEQAYAIIDELERTGYMEPVTKHGKRGGRESRNYIVYGEPQERIIDKYANKIEQINTLFSYMDYLLAENSEVDEPRKSPSLVSCKAP